jgi:branched-chain amino acid transport system substrate-binding protein
MQYLQRITVPLVACLLLAMPLTTQVSSVESTPPEKIKIGAALPLSGWGAASAETPQTFSYKMWAEELNAQGGIYVKDYDRRIPVELILYDDKTDPGTTVKMVSTSSILMPPALSVSGKTACHNPWPQKTNVKLQGLS